VAKSRAAVLRPTVLLAPPATRKLASTHRLAAGGRLCLNAGVPTESVHCVVTSCDNPVAWRRVLQFRQPAEGPAGGTEGRLIAEASVYFCAEHVAADDRLEDAEVFPPPASPDGAPNET